MAMTDEERYDLYDIQEVTALVLSLLADTFARRNDKFARTGCLRKEGGTMKKYQTLTIVLGLLLLTASAGRADTIQAFLDSPADKTGVAGIETIHGWAFATNDAPVSVYLRVDGTTQHDYPLPCCGPREDVQQLVAGAPLNTSYSGVINYARLGSGEHTVGVEIRAEGCEPVILEHTVTVATPGNIEFNEAFSFEDSWTGVDVHNDQILIVNATTGAEMGAANLRVDYALPTQNTGIVEAYNEDATTGDTLDAVQAIFNEHCISCHSDAYEGGRPVAGLDLAEGNMPRIRSLPGAVSSLMAPCLSIRVVLMRAIL